MLATALHCSSPLHPHKGLSSVRIGHAGVGWVFIPVLLWCCSSHVSINTTTPGLSTLPGHSSAGSFLSRFLIF